MSRQSTIFVLSFLFAVAGLIPLAHAEQYAWAISLGLASLLVHWFWTRSDTDNPEAADASYFLGFLLTLAFLAVGLSTLGTGKGSESDFLYQFLNDLGAGLVLTIAGLAIRQVRTLSLRGSRDVDTLAPARPIDQSLHESATVLRDIAEILRVRTDVSTEQQFNESRRRAHESIQQLEHELETTQRRILASLGTLESAVNTAARTLTLTGSTMGDSLNQIAERVTIHVTRVLEQFEADARALAMATRKFHGDAESIHNETHQRIRAELEESIASMQTVQRWLTEQRGVLEDEFQRGVTAVGESTKSFASLSESVTLRVHALPNPAERLEQLWSGIEQLDARLRTSIGTSTDSLVAVGDRATRAATQFEQLGNSSARAASVVERSGSDLAGALSNELRQLQLVLNDFNDALNSRVRSLR